ncbi:hypothetical protein J6590_068115 [Homalodisca vitripennis]|nr:hypothetical protein J6590_068115 [Homalodisca vitripennis]
MCAICGSAALSGGGGGLAVCQQSGQGRGPHISEWRARVGKYDEGEEGGVPSIPGNCGFSFCITSHHRILLGRTRLFIHFTFLKHRFHSISQLKCTLLKRQSVSDFKVQQYMNIRTGYGDQP